MLILYKTRPNTTGNTSYLLTDGTAKTYRTNCSFWTYADTIVKTTKTAINDLKTELKKAGYTCTD